jgi:cytochrome c oxidase subunit III
MSTNINILEEPKKQLSMNPKKFAMWLFLVSVTMIFAALTSAYIVRMGEGNWREFALPVELWWSTGIILLSSATLHWGYTAAKRDNLEMVKLALSISTMLGVGFLVSQLHVYNVLIDMGIHMVGNPSESFLYILTGMHGLHLISGIIYMVLVLADTFRYKVHSKSLLRLEMCATYWHFLGGLWLYLFIFLLLNH